LEPVPADTYLAAITGSQMKPTKAGDGEYLELELSILDGPQKGRKLWDRLCLSHPNEMTVKFARARLASICQATSVLTPNDSQELHDLPLEVKVALKRRDDNGEFTNEIKRYEKRSTPEQTRQATTDTPPWRRGQ
jgi:hypothetical protein